MATFEDLTQKTLYFFGGGEGLKGREGGGEERRKGEREREGREGVKTCQ